MDGRAEVGVAHAREPLAFTDAALVDAAAVVGGFNGIVRIADAMGIPLEEAKATESAAWRVSLGIVQYAASKS